MGSSSSIQSSSSTQSSSSIQTLPCGNSRSFSSCPAISNNHYAKIKQIIRDKIDKSKKVTTI